MLTYTPGATPREELNAVIVQGRGINDAEKLIGRKILPDFGVNRQNAHLVKLTIAQGDLLRINGDPQPREDMVRLQGNTADIRYRGEFPKWSIDLPITYNARIVSAEQLVAMLDAGGFGTGIGEWRTEKDGQFGRFHVQGGVQ